MEREKENKDVVIQTTVLNYMLPTQFAIGYSRPYFHL